MPCILLIWIAISVIVLYCLNHKLYTMYSRPLHLKIYVLSRTQLTGNILACLLLLLVMGSLSSLHVTAKNMPVPIPTLSNTSGNAGHAYFVDEDTDDDGIPDLVEGATDKDGDGVINSMDLDSDNDGIPDLIEAGGVDADNDGKVDDATDVDLNGLADIYDPGQGGTALPNGDFDGDGKPNALDLDSDGDGIPDVEEAGLPHTSLLAVASGSIGTDGWSVTVNALVSLTLPNSDSDTHPNYLDIDSDNDGITDNVEGQFTNQYVLPSGIDIDNDGIDDAYDADNFALSFYNSNGIIPVNFQGAVDILPDYIDPDTDDDNISDLIEGHDANQNGVADYTLTGTDTDGDGLDDGFDLVTGPNVKNEGMDGTTPPFFPATNIPADPPTPGSRGPLQKVTGTDLDRAWRTIFVGATLPLTLVKFSAEKQAGNTILVTWQAQHEVNFKEYVLERSTDGMNYAAVAIVAGKGGLLSQYAWIDNTGLQSGAKIYYRLRQVDTNNRITYSRILSVSLTPINGIVMLVTPNPSNGNAALKISSAKKRTAFINIIDNEGRILASQRAGIANGDNIIMLTSASRLASGIYTVVLNTGEEKVSVKLIIQK